MKTLDIDCIGYSVKTDVYEGAEDGPVILSLIGRTSRRNKPRYVKFWNEFADQHRITTVIFDYSGHGDSPFDIDDIRPAQNFLEVITVFDWLKEHYPNREVIVIGSSYGGYLATQLTKYRQFDKLLLRAPAIYMPDYFYTKKRDENRDATDVFRKDRQAISQHPLLARASKFAGESLVIVHQNDELVPSETTDAYISAFGAKAVVIKDAPHSLDDSTDEEITEYHAVMLDWILGTHNINEG